MVKGRTDNTLFMLISLDGKISTGSTDNLDVDKDFPKIKGVKEGLQQYYDIEKTTELHSFNTGRVMAKIGINKRKNIPKKLPVRFIIVDNKPHLNKNGVNYLTTWLNKLYLVTTNKNHPAYKMNIDNLEIIYYKNKINFKNLFKKLNQKYKIKKITIQSGGTLNSELIRNKLIDHVSIVIAPCLIGGKDTSTLVDGFSLTKTSQLSQIKALKLKTSKVLKNSYLHLTYDVISNTKLV